MSSNRQYDDPDDLFAHTRMSLGDHIEELRLALWRALQGFGVAVLVGIFIAEHALRFISAPVESQLREFWLKQIHEQTATLGSREDLEQMNAPVKVAMTFSRVQLREAVGLPNQEAGPDDKVTLAGEYRPLELAEGLKKTLMLLNPPPTLSVLSVTEGFVIWMQMTIYCGVVLGSPWIFYQLWMFVAAGLYPHEKKYIYYFLPTSLGLFLAGVVLCELIVLPFGIRWLLQFNGWLGFKPELRLSEWLSFAIMAPLLFGIAFQTPLVMFFLERVGFLSVETYRANRKMAVFVLLVAAAVLAVAPDPLSWLALALPMVLLYELGILMCAWIPKPASDLDVPDPEEMVEV
jgi:sec-independent protein translocase protein TatC